jgi:4-hydroxythreonine-4-phosphate dehydrogenase
MLALHHRDRQAYRPLIVGDLSRLELARSILDRHHRLKGPPLHLRPISAVGQARFDLDDIEVLDLDNVPGDLAWGRAQPAGGAASFAYLDRALQLALAGQVDAICTAPINRDAWKQASISYPGPTEALAELSHASRYTTMLMNGHLRVVHVTTHVSLDDAIHLATTERILDTIELGADWLRWAGITRGSVAVAGLNPHAGEDDLLGGSAEQSRIAPAVRLARGQGLNVIGPLWPDTVFARAAAGEFDLVVAQYHDQGHIPVKMLGIETAVSVTIGLPVVHVSVDHGPAFNIAGKGVAREQNLLAAIDTAARLALIQKWQCSCGHVGAHQHHITSERTSQL